MRYIDLGDRGRLNSIRFGENESVTHFGIKCEQCWRLHEAEKHFYTEAKFAAPYIGRADILVLDDFKVIEIVCSENDTSIASKRRRYPDVFDIEVVKA